MRSAHDRRLQRMQALQDSHRLALQQLKTYESERYVPAPPEIKAISKFVVLLLLNWKVLRSRHLCHLLPLRYAFKRYSFLPKSKFSDFGQKPWTIIRSFDRN